MDGLRFPRILCVFCNIFQNQNFPQGFLLCCRPFRNFLMTSECWLSLSKPACYLSSCISLVSWTVVPYVCVIKSLSFIFNIVLFCWCHRHLSGSPQASIGYKGFKSCRCTPDFSCTTRSVFGSIWPPLCWCFPQSPPNHVVPQPEEIYIYSPLGIAFKIPEGDQTAKNSSLISMWAPPSLSPPFPLPPLSCCFWFCSFAIWNTMMGTSILSIPWGIKQVSQWQSGS